MTSGPGQEPEEPDETLALGPDGGRTGPRNRVALLVVALVVAVGAAAFVVGRAASGPPSTPQARVTVTAAPPSTTTAPLPTSSSLAADGPTCSRQVGHRLQLGVRVANGFDDAVTIRGVVPILPLSGGLQAGHPTVGVCGQIGSILAPKGYQLPADSTVWLLAWFRVLVASPTPYPVQFLLQYGRDGHNGSVLLAPFPDLGHVPYSGCRTASG